MEVKAPRWGRGLTNLRALLLLPGLAGCTVGPNFHRPAVQSPRDWGAERTDVPSVTMQSAIDAQWWQSFGDPELTSLVKRLVAQNLDLKTAAERVLQGRDQSRIVGAQGMPSISEQGSYTRNRESPTGILSLVTPAPGAPLAFDLFEQGLSSSWELDLFGRVRRAEEAANADTAATVELRHSVALTSISDLAQDYMQLRGVQASIGIVEESQQIAEQNVQLVKIRFANGYATTLDMAQAQAQQETVAEALPDLQTQEAALINAIGLLLGETPRALQAELDPMQSQPVPPQVVSIGLPGTLVRQRPDVREAEAKLHAATAQTGVAIANFYPDVSLVGSFNVQGLRLADAFNLPSQAFAVGPSISLPIFEGGRLRGQLQLRKSQQREAAIDFQQTVLQAWNDVDDALTAYAQEQHRRQVSADIVMQNENALEAAQQQYAQGFADFLNVDTAQAQLLQSREDYANTTAQVDIDLVALYRALGGGWQIADDPNAQITAWLGWDEGP